MKSILLSLPPEQVVNILNGKQTVIVRKTMPKEKLPMTVYLYCSDSKDFLLDKDRNYFLWDKREHHYLYEYENEPKEHYFQKKVVAKFTLRDVERFIEGLNEVEYIEYGHVPKVVLDEYDYYGLEDLMEEACLTDEELSKYAPDLSFYAWYVSDLQIFDTPKRLDEFSSLGKVRPSDCESCEWRETCETSFHKECDGKAYHQLKRAPSDWRYVEA